MTSGRTIDTVSNLRIGGLVGVRADDLEFGSDRVEQHGWHSRAISSGTAGGERAGHSCARCGRPRDDCCTERAATSSCRACGCWSPRLAGFGVTGKVGKREDIGSRSGGRGGRKARGMNGAVWPTSSRTTGKQRGGARRGTGGRETRAHWRHVTARCRGRNRCRKRRRRLKTKVGGMRGAERHRRRQRRL